MSEEQQPNDDMELVVVYRAPDDVTANLVCGLLQSEGIEAAVQQRASALGGHSEAVEALALASHKLPRFEIVVTPPDLQRSLDIIQAYEPEQDHRADRQAKSWQSQFCPASVKAPVTVCIWFTMLQLGSLWVDEVAQQVTAFMAATASLIYALVMARWQRYVPEQFTTPNRRVSRMLLAIAGVQMALFLGLVGLCPVPRLAIVVVDGLILAACIIVLCWRLPAKAKV